MKSIFGVLFVSVLILTYTLFPIISYAGETASEREARLKAELAQVEREQAETEKILATQKGQTASISRDIQILDTKIKAAQLNIKAKNLQIESLGKDITRKQAKIDDLEDHITRGRETLSQIMRKSNELGTLSFEEFILGSDNLSHAFIDLDNFASVEDSMRITFERIRDDKSQTETEKTTLSTRKNQEQDALAVIQTEKKNIEKDEKEKRRLLAISKGNEATYAQEVAQKKAKAAQIRAALFELAGGSKAIPFGDALKYALEAQKITGVRPAFLLAIITQESNLGANVGSCYMTDLSTGNGIGKNSGTPFEQVMKAPRDTVPFVEITKSLGRDWKTTAVSCPIGSTNYYVGRGFGGAMGPSQFIPSTWQLFKARIASKFGIDTPDPWNPEHAFFASAIYLADLGGVRGSYTGEVAAACKYFGSGGASCTYGAQVLAKATLIQTTKIDPLQGL